MTSITHNSDNPAAERGSVSLRGLVACFVLIAGIACFVLPLLLDVFGGVEALAYVADPSAAYSNPPSQSFLSTLVDQHPWVTPLLVVTFLMGLVVTVYSAMSKSEDVEDVALHLAGMASIAFPLFTAAVFGFVFYGGPSTEGSFDTWAQGRYGVEIAVDKPSDGATVETSAGDLVTIREITDRTGGTAYILVTSGAEELPVVDR